MFYFQQLLNQGLAGIDRTGVMTSHGRHCLHHPADRISDRALPGGLARRRCAGSGRSGHQVSGHRDHSRELEHGVSRGERFVQPGGAVHRQQLWRGRHVSELDGSAEAAVCQQWDQRNPSRRSSLQLSAAITTALLLLVAYLIYAADGCRLRLFLRSLWLCALRPRSSGFGSCCRCPEWANWQKPMRPT